MDKTYKKNIIDEKGFESQIRKKVIKYNNIELIMKLFNSYEKNLLFFIKKQIIII